MLASSHNVSELHVCSEHAHLSHDCSALAHHASSSDPDGLCIHQTQSPSPCGGEIDECAKNFDCNICLQICQEPVVAMCGHLFCWPCLYYWLSLHSASKGCPVCKADVQDKIIPLYGCGRVRSLAKKFCGVHIPCRPSVIAHCASRESELHHAIQHVRRQDDGFLGRYMHGAALRRRRFNNEKEFVLHWGFIIVASATIAFFLAC